MLFLCWNLTTYRGQIMKKILVEGHFNACINSDNCSCETNRYTIIFGIAVVIVIVEIIGGVISNSLALLADAGHVFVDAIASLVSITVANQVKKGGNDAQTRKVGGYINALLLGAVSIWVGFEAIERFESPREITSWIMISIAVIGTIGNYVQHRVVESANETHVTQKLMSRHVWSDLLQSIGVVIAGFIIWMSGWNIIDPLISMAIALIMAWWTYETFRDLYTGKYDGSGHCGHHHH